MSCPFANLYSKAWLIPELQDGPFKLDLPAARDPLVSRSVSDKGSSSGSCWAVMLLIAIPFEHAWVNNMRPKSLEGTKTAGIKWLTAVIWWRQKTITWCSAVVWIRFKVKWEEMTIKNQPKYKLHTPRNDNVLTNCRLLIRDRNSHLVQNFLDHHNFNMALRYINSSFRNWISICIASIEISRN